MDMVDIVLNIPFDALIDSPFEDDPPYASEFQQAIGRLVISWGRFERDIDLWLISTIALARRFNYNEVPFTSFKRKTDQLRRLYSLCPPVVNMAGQVVRLTKEAEDCSYDRSMIIHSKVHGYIDGRPPKLKLSNWKFKSGKRLVGDTEISVYDITKISNEINRISGSVSWFNIHLACLNGRLRAVDRGLLTNL